MAKNNKDVRRGIVLYLDGKEVKNNATAIQAEIKKVRRELDKATIGSDEYRRAMEKWKTLQGALAEHRAHLKLVEKTHESIFVKINNIYSKYSGVILGFVASLTGVAIKLNQFRKEAAEKEDSAANLKALTGLDDDSIQWLTQQAETLSTTMEKNCLRIRQSSTEILEAYMLVGSAKPELLKDKEALNAVTVEAMRLAAAAKMDLKDAVDAVTTTLNQFSAGADQAGRYVNVLAAGSKFGAANVTDQAAAILKAGVAANGANVSIEQLVGCIEMLGEKGIKAEEAGTSLKNFFLTLLTGTDETNPAIVGLDTALENLSKKGLSWDELNKMFGKRAINTAKILMDNTEKVKEYTAAVTDTNVAVEQAGINSETTAAKMAQLRNQLRETGMQLSKDLAPIFSKTVNWTSKFIQMLPPLVSWMKKYGLSTMVAAGALLLYYNYTNLIIKVQKTWATLQTFFTTQMAAGTAAVGLYRTALTGATVSQVEMNAAMAEANIVTKAGVIMVGLIRAAYFALSLQLTACARTLRVVKAAIAESGVGLLVLAVGAAAAAIINHNEKMKEAKRLAQEQREAEKALYKEYDEARARITQLRRTAADYTASLEDRQKAITELQKIAPEYQASINEEGRLIEQNTDKLDEYLKRLKASIVLEAYKSKLAEKLQQQLDLQEKLQDASDNYWNIRQNNTLSGYDRNSIPAKLLRLFGREDETAAKKLKDKLERSLSNVNAEIDDTEQRMKDLAAQWNFSLVDESPTEPTSPTELAPSGATSKKKGKNEAAKKALEAIEAKYAERLNALKERYRHGEIKSEQEYNQQVEDLELERLEESLKIAGLEPKQRAELQAKVLDIYLQTKKKLDAVLNDNETANLSSYKKQLKELEIKEKEERATVGRAHSLGLLDEEVYQKTLADIQRKYQKQREKALENSEEHKRWMEILKKNILSAEAFQKEHNGEMFSFFFRLRKEINDAEMKKLELDKNSEAYKQNEEYLDALIKLYNDKGKVITDLALSIGESLGNALADGINGEWEDVQSAFKSMLVMVLDAIEKMIEASMLVPTLQMLTGVGAGKAWASLAKLAAVKITFAALKQSVQYYDTGGFTGDGRWDEPRGIVHAGEFVANRYAVANTAVRPVLDLLDQAQRTGTIRNLTAEDIAAVAGHSSSHSASVTSRATRTTTAHSVVDAETKMLLRECTDTMRRVKERFDQPIVAETYATGRGGVNEAQKLVDKMNKNAKKK